MLTCTVREPDPWRGCVHEQEANEEPTCGYCGEPVEDEDQTCAQCLADQVERMQDDVAPI